MSSKNQRKQEGNKLKDRQNQKCNDAQWDQDLRDLKKSVVDIKTSVKLQHNTTPEWVQPKP